MCECQGGKQRRSCAAAQVVLVNVLPRVLPRGTYESEFVELARGIEPPTCGLQTPSDTTSDHLTPRETTQQPTPTMGADGAVLSCPGSSVVADLEGEHVRLEYPAARESIGPDLVSSVRSQSHTEESEGEKAPIKPDRTR